VGTGDLLIHGLGEHAEGLAMPMANRADLLDTEGVAGVVGPEGDLGHDLVGERAGHD
jgi:hypothetical protein